MLSNKPLTSFIAFPEQAVIKLNIKLKTIVRFSLSRGFLAGIYQVLDCCYMYN